MYAQAESLAALEACFLATNAAKQVQTLIGLTEQQRQTLEGELECADEDSILVLHANPSAVCDSIATFNMPAGERRDAGDGCHQWIFHFALKMSTHAELPYPEAFCLSPDAMAVATAAGATVRSTEPMALAVVVHKLVGRRNDVQESAFFYL